MFVGFTFKELALIQASISKVNCCDFSSDGKLLATGGHDKKVCGSWSSEFSHSVYGTFKNDKPINLKSFVGSVVVY